MSSVRLPGLYGMAPRPVVHLELHTGDLPRACDFYAGLCGWRPEEIRAGGGSYWSLGTGRGVVECDTPAPVWLPYVAVRDVIADTDHAEALGASILLDPREGPAGWRSVVSTPAGGQIALWQPKR
jgi:predicted enzyme related to lactoylglutathione lyase